jgi:hypothetical protein
MLLVSVFVSTMFDLPLPFIFPMLLYAFGMRSWHQPMWYKDVIFFFFFYYLLKGEELRKLIGAPVYIECSSKTQQVCNFSCHFTKGKYVW